MGNRDKINILTFQYKSKRPRCVQWQNLGGAEDVRSCTVVAVLEDVVPVVVVGRRGTEMGASPSV